MEHKNENVIAASAKVAVLAMQDCGVYADVVCKLAEAPVEVWEKVKDMLNEIKSEEE